MISRTVASVVCELADLKLRDSRTVGELTPTFSRTFLYRQSIYPVLTFSMGLEYIKKPAA